MMAPFPIVPVKAKEKHKEKEKHSTKQERSNVIIEVSLSICVKYPPSLTTTFNCVCHPLRGRRRGGGGLGGRRGRRKGGGGSGTVALPRLVRKASLCQYHCASPALLTLLNPHPAPRHVFQRGTRTARVNLNLILTGMFLAERHRKVFLELSPHSNLWA